MASGVVSAARMINSATPRLRVLVAVNVVSIAQGALFAKHSICLRQIDFFSGLLHTFVGSLLGLAVVGSLLEEIQQLLGEGLVGHGPCGGGFGGHGFEFRNVVVRAEVCVV